MADTIVTLAVTDVSLLPVFISSHSICLIIHCLLIGIVTIVGLTHCRLKVYIAGQRTEIVHNAIDTEVVAMVVFCSFWICLSAFLLVQRHLPHTVDGIFRVVDNLRHTVLCTLHHHTASKHTTEVCTLDCVHRSSGIDGTYTILLPIVCVDVTIFIDDIWLILEQCQNIITRQRRSFWMVSAFRKVCRTLIVFTILHTDVSQLIVGTLSICVFIRPIIGYINLWILLDSIIVCSVVGDVQTTIAVHEGQVTVSVQATDTTGTQCDEVEVINIIDRSRGITEYRGTVSEGGFIGRTLGSITTGKYGIVDDDALLV